MRAGMQKCHCGKKAIFYRRYEGRYLCKNHFVQSIESKVRKTIAKYKMLKSGDRIAFGISGGKDSTTVLYILNKILKPRRDIEYFAFSIDEGTGEYRKKSIGMAKKTCKELGVEHHVFSFKQFFGKGMKEKMEEVKKHSKGKQTGQYVTEPCTYCSVARRYIINKVTREMKATKICLGHNLDDEVQSILMNYIRGDLMRASRAGPITNYSLEKEKGELFVPRIKPLREIPERETALYAYVKKLNVCYDKCPYVGGMRFFIRDFLNDLEERCPGVKFSILRTFDRMLPAIREIVEKEEGSERLSVCKKCGEPTSGEICKACELWE